MKRRMNVKECRRVRMRQQWEDDRTKDMTVVNVNEGIGKWSCGIRRSTTDP